MMTDKAEKLKKYEVRIFYSGFCTYEVEACDPDEAIIKARELPIIEDEILCNLEGWEEADEAEELDDN